MEFEEFETFDQIVGTENHKDTELRETFIVLGDDDGLRCPQCEDAYLHQIDVSIARAAESTEIEYICEYCHGISTLRLEHSEGVTKVRWAPYARTPRK